MVEVNVRKINSGLCLVMLIAVGISCEDNNIQSVNTDPTNLKSEILKEIPSDTATDTTTCDSEIDKTCTNSEELYSHSGSHITTDTSLIQKEGQISQESQLEYHTKQEDSLIKEQTDNDNEITDKVVDITVSETLADVEDVQQEEILTSEENLIKDTDAFRTDGGNSSSNSSTVVQWFRYIVEQFLEEFKDGIYSKPAEPANVTETNLSVPLVNETIEPITETTNTTETLEAASLNITDTTNATDTKRTKFHCTGRNVTDNANATVHLITSARLLQLLAFDKNETENQNQTDCLLVMFYAPWCQFCARTAPHYNAVARAFPQLDFVAVDTAQFSNLLARFGTVSVPNILVFHQSRAAVKFNQTERIFENFVSFIQNATGLEPNVTVNVTEADYLGPIPSVPTEDTDYLLLISWIFVIFCSSFMFVKSQKGQQWITRVRVLWQEHQHID